MKLHVLVVMIMYSQCCHKPASVSGQRIPGIASQSSTFCENGAERAVDLNSYSMMYGYTSCSITHVEHNPWWMLSFSDVYTVSTVNIERWEGCCGVQLKKIIITVGPGPSEGKYSVCGIGYGDMTAERVNYFDCAKSLGTTVKITAHGHDRFLVLWEVTVVGLKNLTNFAVGGIAAQSSTADGHEASRAIDGNADGILAHDSCAMTDTEDDPWWMVTMTRSGLIREVHVTTRADCCGDLVSLEVHMYAPSDYEGTSVRCGATSHDKVATGVIEVFKCSPVVIAAVVKIIAPGAHRRLTLCEVSAIGTEVPRNSERLIKGGVATQSSTFAGHSADRAVDGNADGVLAHQSCTSTNTQQYPWWMLTFDKRILFKQIMVIQPDDLTGQEYLSLTVTIGPVKRGLLERCYQHQYLRRRRSLEQTSVPVFECDSQGSTVNITTSDYRVFQLKICEVIIHGQVVGHCEGTPCRHGGTCIDTGSDFRCECTVHYRGKRCEECAFDMIDYDNKKSAYDGQRRRDATTLGTCRDVCSEEMKNCTAFDFKNGVCHVHTLGNYVYDQPQTVDSYGYVHYSPIACVQRLDWR